MHRLPIALLLLCGLHSAKAEEPFSIPPDTRQLIVGIAKDWNSSHVTLQTWQRDSATSEWQPASSPWPARTGHKGLAWGLGLHPPNPPNPPNIIPPNEEKGNPVEADSPQKEITKRAVAPLYIKTEGDGRAPAGVFRLGGAYGYASKFPHPTKIPYSPITPRDLWVDDPASPFYNDHIRLTTDGPSNDWERRQQMKLNDPPHRLKLFIRHNAPPHAKPGAGSAIFFHIWRDKGLRATAGCTTMPQNRLTALIRWLDPALSPLFILLPFDEYSRLQKSWNLPPLPQS